MWRCRFGRLLALGIFVAVLGALPLAACNSGSASRSATSVSGTTATEETQAQSTTSKSLQRAQGQTLFEAAASKLK